MTWTIADGVNAASDEDEARFYGELMSVGGKALADVVFWNAFGYPCDRRTISYADPTAETLAWLEAKAAAA
jgi:hypothetical protein